MKDIVQVRNPRSNRYIKIDRARGRILSHKKSEGAYKGISVAGKNKCSDCAFFLNQDDWCEKYSDFKVTCPSFISKTIKKVA
jgi:hypothetical protein